MKRVKGRKNVYSLEAYDKVAEESVDEHSSYGCTMYYSEKAALAAARGWKKELAKWIENEVKISLVIGGYQVKSGDVYGEPMLIPLYTIKPRAVKMFYVFGNGTDQFTESWAEAVKLYQKLKAAGSERRLYKQIYKSRAALLADEMEHEDCIYASGVYPA